MEKTALGSKTFITNTLFSNFLDGDREVRAAASASETDLWADALLLDSDPVHALPFVPLAMTACLVPRGGHHPHEISAAIVADLSRLAGRDLCLDQTRPGGVPRVGREMTGLGSRPSKPARLALEVPGLVHLVRQ